MTKKHKQEHSGEESKVKKPETAPESAAEAVAETLSAAELSASLAAAEQEVIALKAQLADTQAKIEEYRDTSMRALADFQNLRRRTERDQLMANQNATANVIKRYLEVFDDLERALNSRPKGDDARHWVEGVELTYRKFLNFLGSEGVSLIQAEGMPFDPNQHEAISQEDSPDHESGMVIGVVQQGYRLGDRVLRPARVRVAR
jgi:molecular chaperone GrpE